MKKRTALLFTALLITSSVVASAEKQTYSDESISFTYDNEWYGKISSFSTEDHRVYTFDTQTYKDLKAPSVSIRFSLQTDINDSVYTRATDGFIGEKYEYTPIGDYQYVESEIESGDLLSLCEILYYDGSLMVSRLISAGEDQTYWEEAEALYDSIELPENFIYEPYESEDEYGIDFKHIYENAVYSDQISKYANALVETIDQYLSFDIDMNEAIEKAKTILDRAETYADSSDYISDPSFSLAFISLKLSIGWDDDFELMQMKNELANYIN